jgi:hypothetical protein
VPLLVPIKPTEGSSAKVNKIKNGMKEQWCLILNDYKIAKKLVILKSDEVLGACLT